jgi:hypothetical protein
MAGEYKMLRRYALSDLVISKDWNDSGGERSFEAWFTGISTDQTVYFRVRLTKTTGSDVFKSGNVLSEWTSRAPSMQRGDNRVVSVGWRMGPGESDLFVAHYVIEQAGTTLIEIDPPS